MSLGSTIFEALSSDAGLSALLLERIYPTQRPPRCLYPCLTWQRIAGGPAQTHSGPLCAEEARLRFTCWAATHEAAEGLSEALRETLPALGPVADVITIADGLEADGDRHYFIVETAVWYEPAA